MAQKNGPYPSVFVVDSEFRPPPLPPRPGHRFQHSTTQRVLVVLVIVALCGMILEACFIYHLYSSKEDPKLQNIPETSMRKADKGDAASRKQSRVMKPPKPMAHLTTGWHLAGGVLLWNQTQEQILHGVRHTASEGKLVIAEEGYYSVYSKICFKEDAGVMSHSVVRKTSRLSSGEILLLQSRRFEHKRQERDKMDNSYISGSFHLFKDDAIFVRVQQCNVVFSNSAENFFGLYMV